MKALDYIMMQADHEHNFNWPVNCPAVTTHEKGLLSVCVIIIITIIKEDGNPGD